MLGISSYGGTPSSGTSLGSAFTSGLAKPVKKITSSVAPPRTTSTYRPPAPTYYSAPRPAVGNTPTGQIAPSSPPPQPKPMTPDQWLATDTSYKSQRAAYENALRDYAAQYSNEQNKYSNEWNANVQKLGTDRGLAQTAMSDDYASRGLSTSGLYADAMNKFNTEWDTRQSDLERAKQAYLNDLLLGKQNFEKEQGLLVDKAKQDAMNRRADRYGL